MNKKQTASMLLRIGLSITFFYAAISSFINPSSWIGFFPQFLRNIFSGNFLLTTFSAYEILLGLWLFSNKKIFLASIISSVTLASVIIFNINSLEIVFRDIGLLFAALALVFLAKNLQSKK